VQSQRFLGIFVNPLYVQSEGLQQVFDNLDSVGTTAICIVTNVARKAEAGKGRRFPDLHIDGYERLVARPVWGEREIYLDQFKTYEPDQELYKNCLYKPKVEQAPADLDFEIPNQMIVEAHKRGMQVHVLVSPFLPPTVRPEDQPRLVDGSPCSPPRVANNACLNAPEAEAYALALMEDVAQHYPDTDGLMPDWVEFGAYRFDEHFTCFCPHCEQKARDQGFDWDQIKRDVTVLWDWFHSLTPRELERSLRLLSNPSELLDLLVHYPGWVNFLQFKSSTVVSIYRKTRQRLNKLGLQSIGLSARGWPPPWNRSSGMDYRALADVCSAVTPKLFTFDYSVLPRWYGQTLLVWNPGISESAILDALVEWMNLPDDFSHRSFANYIIPAPTELHPARLETYRTRLDEVADQVKGRTPFYPFAHAYLPEPQWKRMVALIRDSRADGMWVQMYGYLSERKLEILKNVWR
jgi:hypothetical protein